MKIRIPRIVVFRVYKEERKAKKQVVLHGFTVSGNMILDLIIFSIIIGAYLYGLANECSSDESPSLSSENDESDSVNSSFGLFDSVQTDTQDDSISWDEEISRACDNTALFESMMEYLSEEDEESLGWMRDDYLEYKRRNA